MNIVEVKDLHMYFPILKGVLFHSVAGHVKAVDGVSFSIPEGETLGLVGESGSGKSTVGNMLLRLLKPTSGEILYRGRSILSLSPQEEREFRSRAQMVFQNPFASLNPRMIVGDIIGRVLRVQRPELKKDEVRERVLNGMQEVGLKVEHMTRYPHEFSGGQRQRIAIARALISTSRPRRWTFPCRRRSSTCSRTFRRKDACPICSSATTCRSSATSATASP